MGVRDLYRISLGKDDDQLVILRAGWYQEATMSRGGLERSRSRRLLIAGGRLPYVLQCRTMEE